MQARIVASVNGLRWLAEGWRIFRAAPIGWFALVFAYWLLMTLVSVVPFVGVAIASVLVPPLSLGFMAAARAASHGARIELTQLFEGFRHERRTMLVLGAVYLACLAAVLGGTAIADDGGFARWMLTGQRPADEALQSDEFLGVLSLAAVLYTPVMMMFWFAPPLAAWHSSGAAKALFFSFFACLMNWRAFLVYGAMSALIMLVLPFLALGGALLLSGGTMKLPVMGLAFPLLMIMLPTLFASFYASYRDVFAEPAAP